jgi:hypothetical protein
MGLSRPAMGLLYLLPLCCHISSFYSVLKPIKVAKNVVMKELLDNPFSLHLLRDKLRVINKGRRTPLLPKSIIQKTKAEQYTRYFCIFQYENSTG